MTLSKRCINCDALLEPKQSDFCGPECEQEYKDACDQELLDTLTHEAAPTPALSQELPTGKEFTALLENDSNPKKK